MPRSDVLAKPRETAQLFVARYGQLAVFQATVRGYGKAGCGRFNRDLFWSEVAHAAREILNASRVVANTRRVSLLSPDPVSEEVSREGYARRVGAMTERISRRADEPGDGRSHSHGLSRGHSHSSSHTNSHSQDAAAGALSTRPLRNDARMRQVEKAIAASYELWGPGR